MKGIEVSDTTHRDGQLADMEEQGDKLGRGLRTPVDPGDQACSDGATAARANSPRRVETARLTIPLGIPLGSTGETRAPRPRTADRSSLVHRGLLMLGCTGCPCDLTAGPLP